MQKDERVTDRRREVVSEKIDRFKNNFAPEYREIVSLPCALGIVFELETDFLRRGAELPLAGCSRLRDLLASGNSENTAKPKATEAKREDGGD